MGNQYIKCPKCGTRNFSDDRVCGVCNTFLSSDTPLIENSNKKESTIIRKYFIVIILFTGVFYLLYQNFTEKKSETPIDNKFVPNSLVISKYSIRNIEINTKNLFRVKINIDTKLTETELISIAKKVLLDIDAVSTKGIVFFYLPFTNKFNDAWAKVDFPEIEVSFLGQSLTEEQAINASLDKITDYIGIWTSNMMKDGVMIRIREDKIEGYVFEYISPDNIEPSKLNSPLKKIIKNGKTLFIEKESPSGQYYVIEENGDLSDYDKDGFHETYKKIK